MRYMTSIIRLTSTTIALSMILSVAAPAVEAAVVTLLSPPAGEKVTGRNVEVAVGYNTQSSLKVTELQLWIDGKRLASKMLVNPINRGVASFWWNPAKAGPGLHNVAVKMYAGDRLLGTARGSVTVGKAHYDMDAPVVRLSNMEDGQVIKGKTHIKVESRDDSGEPPIVSLLVDNALKLLSNSHPCSYDLDTTQYADGEHEIRLVAFDSSGNKSEAGVVKVVIKNDITHPVVVLPKSLPQPTKVAASEEDYAPKIPPTASIVPKTMPGAARFEPVKPVHAAPPARPTATKPAAAKPTPVKPAAKPVAAKPVSVPKLDIAPVAASAPIPPVPQFTPKVEKLPFPNELAPVVMAKAPTAEPVAALFADVKVLPAKDRQTTTKAPAVRPQTFKSNPAEAFAVAEPATNPPPHVVMDSRSAALPKPPMDPVEIKPEVAPKPVKPILTAMALSTDGGTPGKPAAARPASTHKDGNARLEKKSAPVSGKVKLRDVISGLGGVLFWDSETRSVTAYAPGMKLEAKIGSKVVKVNGRSMTVNTAPVIVGGRTIIDANVYHMALDFARSHQVVDA